MIEIKWEEINVGITIGIVKKKIVWILKTAKVHGMVETWNSEDNGASGRLVPRINTETDENCYHYGTNNAKEWVAVKGV